MLKKVLSFALLVFAFVSIARAQTAEVTIQLNEQFFDALLAAIFKDAKPLEFPISLKSPKSQVPSPKSLAVLSFTGGNAAIANRKSQIANCNESIRLLPEVDGVKTAVRFRDGRIFAPIAFAGKYNPPLVGCVDFSGVAETEIELEFDKSKQTLIGRAKVQNVNLSGTGGIGGGLIARLVQNSIDKKINPLNILEMDKVSFVVPVQAAGNLRMKAVGMRHEVANGALNVYIAYQFSKAE